MSRPEPIACDLTALTPEQRDHHRQLFDALQRATEEVRELPDGYAFRYAGGDAMWLKAAEFVTLERRCCPFLRFALELNLEDASICLHLTGNEQVKAFLDQRLQALSRFYRPWEMVSSRGAPAKG